MKKTVLSIVFCCWGMTLAPHESRWLPLPTPREINPYTRVWEAVCEVESGSDPAKYNKKENAVGIAQIRQVMLDDYNQRTGNHLLLEQMYDTNRVKSVFMYYASRHRPDQVEQIVRFWNGGSRGMKKESTKKYYQDIISYLESI